MIRLRAAALASVAAAVAWAAPAPAQERVGAEVSCSQVGKTMVYDCMLMLKGKSSGRPVEGAAATVGADMPAMPMAHNVKPVRAEPTGRPGEYRFKIEIEMHGEWALKIRLAKPWQDLIVHKMTFAPR